MLGMVSYNFLFVVFGVFIGGVEVILKIWDIVGFWVIVKVVGVIWILLGLGDIFFLKIGKDYLNYFFFVLVVGNEKLVFYFLLIVEFLRK